MRAAHFANEVVILPSEPVDELKMAVAIHCDGDGQNDNLKQRIEEFKNDSNNMSVMSEFIDKVLQQAETEANRHNNIADLNQTDKILADLDYQNEDKTANGANTSKHGNGKVTNLARVFVSRMFDAIYNCANNAVNTSLPRFKHGNLANFRATGSPCQKENTALDRKNTEEKEHNEGGRKYPLHEKTKNFLLKGTTNLMKSSNAN